MDGGMPEPLIVVLWGLLAVALITAVGRWCRTHPGPARQPAEPRTGCVGMNNLLQIVALVLAYLVVVRGTEWVFRRAAGPDSIDVHDRVGRDPDGTLTPTGPLRAPSWTIMVGMARGKLRIYLGAAPGVGQDLRDARRGPPPGRARHRRGGRLRRDPRPAAHRGACSTAWRSCPGARSTTAARTFTEMDVDAVLARRPDVAAGRRARAHQRAGLAQRQALAGRRGAARRRASTSSPPSTSSTWSRSTTSSRRSPASASGRPCPTRWSAAPTRSSWSTCPRRRCAAAWRTATSTPPDKVDAALSQLLPARQPHRAARAGPAVGGRPGRRVARSSTGRAPTSTDTGRPASGSSSR